MIIETAACVAGMLALRRLGHIAILRGLRAPRIAHAQGPGDHGFGPDQAREVRIPGLRGRHLFGWLVSPRRPDEEQLPAVLAMHGWGANAAMMWPAVPPLHTAGFAVLLIDARCHGRSDDEEFASMPRFAEDIACGLTWLRQQPEIAPDRLAVLGHSVGAAAAMLHAARHRDVRAVLSLSAFAHPAPLMRSFMAEKRVPYPLLGWYLMRHVQRVIGASFDAIAPINTLPSVQCPVLLVHGRADTVVPVTDAHALAAASSRARLLLVDGDHDLSGALVPHARPLIEFLRAACADQTARHP